MTSKLIGLLAALLATIANAAEKPNIIFILADDLGYGEVGCYGQKEIRTPNIDRLADEGIRFTHGYSGNTVCAPSRCTLMTGLHNGHARIRSNGDGPLEPGDVTVAEVLKRAGYTTGLFGKWGLGEAGTTGVPNRKGFDEWFGYLNQTHAHNYYPDFLWRNETKVTIPGNVVSKGVASKSVTYSNDLFTDEALSFVERHRDKPFFLYLTYTIPHANNERGKAEGNGMEVPSDEPYTDKPWPAPEKNKAAMITRLDGYVGKLMQKLKDLKLDEKTIVFFSSDNGPHKEGGIKPDFFRGTGELRGIKRDLTDGGIRVPMIVRWPTHIEPRQVREDVWGFIDFLPTAADLAGVPAPAELDGISVVPALLGKASLPADRFLYWEFHERGYQQAVRWQNWKALRLKAGEPVELYDVKSDPGETKNVAADHPDVVAKVEAYLKTAWKPSKQWPQPRKGATNRETRP